MMLLILALCFLKVRAARRCSVLPRNCRFKKKKQHSAFTMNPFTFELLVACKPSPLGLNSVSGHWVLWTPQEATFRSRLASSCPVTGRPSIPFPQNLSEVQVFHWTGLQAESNVLPLKTFCLSFRFSGWMAELQPWRWVLRADTLPLHRGTYKHTDNSHTQGKGQFSITSQGHIYL